MPKNSDAKAVFKITVSVNQQELDYLEDAADVLVRMDKEQGKDVLWEACDVLKFLLLAKMRGIS